MANIYDLFALEGAVISCARYGSGHINETYLVVTDQPHLYILQKLSTQAFRNPEGLMDNIIRVTDHLRTQDADPRHALTLVPTHEGKLYHMTDSGECWRVYEFVTESICLNAPRNAEDFRQSGVAFGSFQNMLAGFPADTLSETIPHFHDTPARYEQLKQAIREDRAGHAASVQPEIDFYLSREKDASVMMDLMREGKLPVRVTHNDTKLNNVMLDRQTGAPLCVIDLDTVMPGLAANDFGDSIRFGASTAAEDETDLSKVTMSIDLFETYVEGFLSACGDRLTKLEKETLPWGAKLMTLECGSRFLADYLNGDVYFHIAREHHNLDRTRTQMKLVEDMERQWDEMQAIVNKYV